MSSASNDISSMRRRGDARLQQLEQWLREVFGDADFSLAVASADASFRRYFRVTRHGETSIAMDAPPDKEDIEPYVRIAGMLVSLGVNAPRVSHYDSGLGFVLNSDLGTQTYLAALADATQADRLYGDALTALVRIQAGAERQARALPPYDAQVLRREMALFPEWFCARHLRIQLDARRSRELDEVFDVLIAEALQQPRVFVHRDYHSRNLMVCDGERHGPNPGILDFQDALYGPVTYDLVSLLRDCYIRWPAAQVRAWVAQFRDQAAASGVDVGTSLEQFQRWFDFMGIQRHLKVLGIFARLFHRDGKAGYLKDLPLTLAYVLEALEPYSQLQPLQRLLQELVVPAFEAGSAT